jgi:hypothetical protein
MKRLFAATLVLFGMTIAPADAASVTTFSGSCVLRGDDVFTPALTFQPKASAADADVSGTCRGTLSRADGTAKKLTSAPARLDLHTSSSSLSCGGGALSGSATLHIDGATIPMKVNEPQVTAISVLLITGAATGHASGLAYADTRTDLLGTVQACTGAGVASVPITLSFTTLTPIG